MFYEDEECEHPEYHEEELVTDFYDPSDRYGQTVSRIYVCDRCEAQVELAGALNEF